MLEKVIDYLVENGDIASEDYEVYLYSLRSIVILGGNVLLSLAIGFAMAVPGYCVMFLLALIPLRSSAGGYHASGWGRCFTLSFVTVILSLLSVKYCFRYETWLLFVLTVISVVVIARYAPLEDSNKPLDAVQRMRSRQKAMATAVIELVAGLLLLAVNDRLAYVVWEAVIWCAIGYAGWFVKKISCRKE